MIEPLVIVYQATNQLNGKRYIGVTKRGLRDRVKSHRSSANRGSDYLLHRALRKYGHENIKFEVLVDFQDDYELALAYEWEMICKHRPEYNLAAGGEGGTHAPATIAKMRAAKLGRKHTPEVKARRAAMGYRPSAETRAKMSAAQTGRPPTKGRAGQAVPEETKAKISQTLKQRGWQDTPARVASRARTGASAASEARKIAVECVNDGRVFESLKAAAEFYGLVPTKLSLAFRKGWRIRGMRFIRRRAADPMPSGQPDGAR